MPREAQFEKGTRVTVFKHHWLRANCDGEVIETNYHREDGSSHSILVKFDHAEVGGGINGDQLWMNPMELAIERKAHT